jgi:hypothetical protein
VKDKAERQGISAEVRAEIERQKSSELPRKLGL